MPRPRASLTLLLIVMLVVCVTRCVADCTAASCNPAQPPCHHHRQAPGHETPVHDTSVPCAPDVLLPGTVQPHAPQISLFNAPTPALAAPAISGVRLTTTGLLSLSRTFPRLKANLLSSIVLRI